MLKSHEAAADSVRTHRNRRPEANEFESTKCRAADVLPALGRAHSLSGLFC